MGRCELECPDGETECCICCTKQDSWGELNEQCKYNIRNKSVCMCKIFS